MDYERNESVGKEQIDGFLYNEYTIYIIVYEYEI